MRQGSKLILLSYYFFFSATIIAQSSQTFLFNHIDHSNGLLNDAVYAIGQDSTGYIWMSSLNSLQRYDGSRFVNYSHYQASDTTSISPHNFETYTDGDGKKWMIGGQFIYRYDSLAKKRPDRFTVIFPENGYELVFAAAVDRLRDQVWAATSVYGLLLFDRKTKKLYNHDNNDIHSPLLEQLPQKGLRNLMMDSRQNLWLSYWSDSFYRYNLATREISVYSLSTYKKLRGDKSDASLLVNCMVEDDHGKIWIGTENSGLLLYDREKDNFNYISSDPKNNSPIQYNYNIYCIYQDKEENLWIGTDKGISIFNPYRQFFTSIRSETGNPLSLPKYEILACIETPQGDLLIGTWGGGISVYDHNLKFKKNIFFQGRPEMNLVWCFLQRDDGNILIGCQHGYLHIYNPITGQVQTIHPPELQNFTVRCMTKDRQGNILFGLHNGKIATWNTGEKRFYKYSDNPITGPALLGPVLNIFVDHSNNCWVSSETGFKQFDLQKRIYTHTWQVDKENGRCQGIEDWNDSLLLVASTGSGLNLFNKKTKAFTSITAGQELPFNNVFAIKKDWADNTWFTTDYGLYKMRAGQYKFIACNMQKGIINSAFQSNSFYVMQDGRWLTSTLTELIGFYPDSLNRQIENQSEVTITGFKVFNQAVSIDSLRYTNNSVKLSYQQNFLNIEFAALSYYGPKETKYYYQLSGIDKDWVYAGNKRFANYTNLEPGKYTFRVKAENEEEKITTLNIVITPPFWKTNWFRLLCIGLAAAAIYLLVLWRIRTVRKEELSKAYFSQQMADMEMKALRAQMNPHFIFNCISAIDNLIQTDQKDKATVYLTRFAQLIRSVLDSSKNSLVPFYKDYESLQLFLHLEQFRCNNKFDFHLYADQEILNSDIKVPPLIIQPFVENAIHHGLMNKPGSERKLDIQVNLEKDYLKYTIVDNGVGRQTAEMLRKMNKPEHISYGIKISEKRVSLHNHDESHPAVIISDLMNENTPAGTKVECWLSLK